MPRHEIKDFSGGLVTNQSEFDIQENQFQTFEKITNKKPGRLERPKGQTPKSGALVISNLHTELTQYRTEKDSADADTSTNWWISGHKSDTHRFDESDGVGGSWTSILTFASGSPIFDFLVHNQILRIADGSFANNSKWYGHIKRDVLGSNVGSNVYSDDGSRVPNIATPYYSQLYDDWSLTDAEIAAPVIVKMSMSHDGGDDLTSDNHVGLFVYEPRTKYGTADLENDEHNAWTNAMTNETFDPADRYACTYLYDYIQESELSKDANGNIGVTGFDVETGSDEVTDSGDKVFEVLTSTEQDLSVSDGTKFTQYTYIKVDKEIMFIRYISGNTLYVKRGQLNTSNVEHETNADVYYQASPQKGRAINVVLNGFTVSGYHNPRITGVNIYWQPKGDVDWYLVETVDMNRGYADSPLASIPDIRSPGSSNLDVNYLGTYNTNNTLENWGYWIAPPQSTALDDVNATFTLSATAWTGATNDFSNTAYSHIGILSRQETGDSSNMGTQFNRLGACYTFCQSNGANDDRVSYDSSINTNRIGCKIISTAANTDNPNRVTTHSKSQTKISSWYIPFDGMKLATYNSLTGRAGKTKISAIKWNASATMNNRAYYANIDTVDENDQTSREKNQIYFTDPFKLDEIIPGRYITIGKNDGDQILALREYRNKLFVFKKRHTYVINTRHQVEKHFVGVGIDSKHAVFETPLGLVCANQQGIFAVNPTTSKDISFKIRDTWQSLTLDKCKIGYDGVENEIIIAYNANGSDAYVMNLDNGSWVKRDFTSNSLTSSNFVLSNEFRPLLIVGETV